MTGDWYCFLDESTDAKAKEVLCVGGVVVEGVPSLMALFFLVFVHLITCSRKEFIMRRLLCIPFLLFALSLYAQEYVIEWADTLNNGDKDYASAIAVDGNGNVYITGYFYNGSNYDYLTVKYDSLGNVIGIGAVDNGGNDYARAIAVDGNGNVYITGYSYIGAVTNCDCFTVKCVKRMDAGLVSIPSSRDRVSMGNICVPQQSKRPIVISSGSLGLSLPISPGIFAELWYRGISFEGGLGVVDTSGTGFVFCVEYDEFSIDNDTLDNYGIRMEGGDISMLTFLPTGMITLLEDEGIRLYFRGGVGFSIVELGNMTIYFLGDDETVEGEMISCFAVVLGGGIEFEISDGTYLFFQIDHLDLEKGDTHFSTLPVRGGVAFR